MRQPFEHFVEIFKWGLTTLNIANEVIIFGEAVNW